MISAILIIGLTTTALLSLWNSYILGTIKNKVDQWITGTGYPLLIYLNDCDYCKGFWLCVIGAAISSNLLIIFPSYGIVVIGLALQGTEQ